MEFINNFLPLGVFLTFLISLLNIIVNTRNIKRTKFIDTITSERIKWLETIRNGGSEIISELTEFTNHLWIQFEEIKNQDPREDRTAEVNYQFLQNYFNAKNSNILSSNNLWSRSEFVKNLNLFKLRLNYKEDIEIIEILDTFIRTIKSEYSSEEDLRLMNENLEQFTQRLQIILKNEWEKVKKETK